MSVTVQDRYFWQDAAQAHPRGRDRGTPGASSVLIVDIDLAAAIEV